MTDRNLPEWMSKIETTEKDALKQVQTGLYKRNVIEDDLPYLEFTGTVIFSQERNDCSFLSEELRSSLSPGSAVGFDIEWPPSFTKGQKKKVALVQLCASEEKCYLFHLSSMSRFPTGLKIFLEDERIRKVGVGIEGDMWKLLSDFDVKLKNFVELGDLANKRLRCGERWSLDGLVKHLFKKRLFKQKNVRCSNWDDFELSQEQKRYAATDAYAGLIIHNKLNTMDPGVNSRSGLKDKLSQMANEIEELAGSIPEEVNDIQSVATLVEDLYVSLTALRDLLSKNNTSAFTTAPELLSHDLPENKTLSPDRTDTTNGTQLDLGSPGEDEDLNHSNIDLFKVPEPMEEASKPTDYQRDCIMSLDISEYELQMLERQARQEDLEEQSTLEFQEKNALDDSADLLYEVESDEELESKMLQCVEEVERLSQPKQPQPEETPSGPGDEEDDIEELEEEEEEEFDPSLPEPLPEQIKCLKMYFGHSRFKPVQWKVIHSVLKERRDNLVVMATGYGKSLCFQFPPVYCVGISIVICPLIALMEDQVLQLEMSNIPACFLGSAQTKNVLAGLKQGQYRVVYMTPEYCSGNVSLLEQLDRSIGISLIAVDEAHCISEWGHDFRGAYRSLGNLKRSLPNVPIVALTATASPSIREDIVKSLNLERPIVTCTSFDRPNLYLDVNRKSGGVFQDMNGFLKKTTGGDYEFEGSSIVYCPSRKEAERVTSTLTSLGVTCGVYHAGLGIKQRRETQHRFMRDEIQCMVATVAFGMGINKADIRKVIHYGAPKEMESYYQEIGRAGRDGLPSACHVLWAPADLQLNRFLINQVANNRFRGYKLKMMGKMDLYLNSSKCRRKLILSHFEDKQLRKVTSGIMGTDQCCDNCRSGAVNRVSVNDTVDGGRQDYGVLAFQLIGAVSAMGERFGSTAPILFLRGSYSRRVPEKYRCHALFGVGKSVSEACWKALSRELVNEEYLKEATGTSKFCTLCKITPKGRWWLGQALDEKQRTLLLQSSDGDLNTWSALRRKQNAAASTTNAPDRQYSTSLNNGLNVNSRPVNSKSTQRSVMSSSRTPTKFLTQVAVSKPQPAPVSARELELQTVLYAKLVAERQKLASEKDIPPAILATNKILLDMAKIRPCTVSSLKQVDGVSEAKSSMLAPLLKTIASFCELHKLKVDPWTLAAAPGPDSSMVTVTGRPSSLPNSIAITYRLFQEEGKSMRQVSDVRSLPVAVLETQLIQAFRANHPLDTERAGLTTAIRTTVTHIIQSHPVNSDLSDIKAIRARVPDDISTFLIQLTVELLQREGMPTAPPAVSTSLQQPELTWIEPKDKPVKKASVHKPVRTEKAPAQPAPVKLSPPQPDGWSAVQLPDEMEMSMEEDVLFRDLPMPEEVGPIPEYVTARQPLTAAAKAVPQTSAVKLASWNQEPLDEDTQELFSNSPPQNVSQPAKRKLPDWAELPRGSSSLACTKKTKKNKGLFS
ncbi:Werner syndrome ATP-dependent helicase homolog isoform X1 [Coregonus clupeaformis]|uniref:Werner syndrome ATP-dependent helicase homolog isoform X1 n=1 Tax=Coregonus clupeaformis TaxID=59861 RepID=UPI001E1C9B13|nr:Werner syndrome ATP-dependent helicase homolog isoform X1 [Coregonus clupeaformis]XP_041753396.2 Werner syndrome ATP-dependent helicase homolog isoform X1 [Coregonus clupeaformis]XP_041753397.2 Werner syndrome ATP-dependent helicase homolog isoform X1 [Coregonus clupeaformis]